MFYPNYHFNNIYDIPDDFFAQNEIKTILLDIDGTIVSCDTLVVSPRLWEWVDRKKETGMKVILFSNNEEKRVESFSKLLSVPFYFEAKKPLQKIFKKIKREEEGCFCIIGDQIFTDVLGGNRAKMLTILVDPIEDKDALKGFLKFKRSLEKPFRKEKKRKDSAGQSVAEEVLFKNDSSEENVTTESSNEKPSEDFEPTKEDVVETAPPKEIDEVVAPASENVTQGPAEELIEEKVGDAS